MKTYLMTICFMILGPGSIAQSIELTFEGIDNNSSQALDIDSIRIINTTTQEEDVTSASTYTLNMINALPEPGRKAGALLVSEVYPNPASEILSFEVSVTKAPETYITVYDIGGKICLNQKYLLKPGKHRFNLCAGGQQLYFIKIQNHRQSYVRKALFLKADGQSPVLQYKSYSWPVDKVKKLTSSISYHKGDELLLIAYRHNYTDYSTYDSPDADKKYVCTFFEIGTFTDSRDQTEYKWVNISGQVWMAENLKYLSSVSPSDSGSETDKLYYVYDYYGNDVTEAKAHSNYKTYGVLYNWPAAVNNSSGSSGSPSGVQGVCPAGWHLPSDAEWKELEINSGLNPGETDSSGWRGTCGLFLKERGVEHWNYPNNAVNNNSGFTALPGGYRYSNGLFNTLYINARFWTSTDTFDNSAWNRILNTEKDGVYRNYVSKEYGMSVRCVKD